MAKLTKQQRDYFTNRIKEQFNLQLGPLEKDAALKKADFVSERKDEFIDNLGLTESLNEYEVAINQVISLQQTLSNTLTNLCEQYDIIQHHYGEDKYEWQWETNVCQNLPSINTALLTMCRKECEEAFKQFPEGQKIEKLKTKKREALDYIMGYDQSTELLDGLANILLDSGVKMLEEYKESDNG